MTTQSTSLTHNRQQTTHRISYTVLTSFSLLTLLVLLITFFSWRELNHQQNILATFAHSALPKSQKITESHATLQHMGSLIRNLSSSSSANEFSQANRSLQELVEARLGTILATAPDNHHAIHALLDTLEQLALHGKERVQTTQKLQEQRTALYTLHGQWIAGIRSLPEELSEEVNNLFLAVPQQLLNMMGLHWETDTIPGPLSTPLPAILSATLPAKAAQGQSGSSSFPSNLEQAENSRTGKATGNDTANGHGNIAHSPANGTTATGITATREVLFGQTRDSLKLIAETVRNLPQPAQKIWNPLIAQTDKILFDSDGYAQTVLRESALEANIEIALHHTADALTEIDGLVHTAGIASLSAINTTAEQAETSLKIFSRFFILSSILAVFVASLTIIFYYKAFYIRIKHLQEYLLLNAKGHRTQLTTEGDDEVSALSHAIEHYVAETDKAIELVEASSKTKSDFLVSINHEIRTPLNAIIGYTRMTNETSLTSTQKSYLDKIVQATHYLLGIMNTMLNFSKVEADMVTLEIAPFNLQESLDSATSFARSKASAKGLVFEVDADPTLPAVIEGDALRLSQIINNLTINAVNYTHSGKILVSVEPVHTEDSTIHIKFAVADEGIGMTKQQVDALFAPSSSTDEHALPSFAGATGLGLTISKSLCTLMGGTLTAKSAPGQGSTFSFTLPFELNAEASASNATDNTVPDLSGRAILLAEDNLINQEIALALLEKTNASVTIANNGLEATDLAQANRYDLILMDIKMPMMSGIAATKNILEYHRAGQVPPIIAMTANAMDEDRQESLDAGMKDYITKPIEAIVFYQMLRKWCLPDTDEKQA